MIWFFATLVAMAVVAWGFRLAGQVATGNTPKFRDMPYGVAYGYVLGVFLLLWLV